MRWHSAWWFVVLFCFCAYLSLMFGYGGLRSSECPGCCSAPGISQRPLLPWAGFVINVSILPALSLGTFYCSYQRNRAGSEFRLKQGREVELEPAQGPRAAERLCKRGALIGCLNVVSGGCHWAALSWCLSWSWSSGNVFFCCCISEIWSCASVQTMDILVNFVSQPEQPFWMLLTLRC